MAYVLGFLYADGDIVDAQSSRTQYIKFTSKDQEILLKIRSVLSSRHTVQRRLPHPVVMRHGKRYVSSILFYFRIGSRRMYLDLQRIGLTPNKSKTIFFPDIPEKFFADFTRGYFDGDGCVYVEGMRTGNFKKISVIFTSGSYKFLEELARSLKKFLNLQHDKIYKGSNAFQLRYRMRDTLKILSFMYTDVPKNLCLQRKREIYHTYLRKRPDARVV